jgi:hypothetical protein
MNRIYAIPFTAVFVACTGGGGGGGSAGLLPVDCVDPPGAGNVNPNLDPVTGDPRCDPSIGGRAPGLIGMGPPLDIEGSSVRMEHGFVDTAGNRLVFPIDAIFIASGNGALFAVDLDTGDRTIVSGTAHDPRTGASTVGDGPTVGHFYDIQPGPDGWVALVDTGEISQLTLMTIDPATGARTLATRNLATDAWPGCEFPENPSVFYPGAATSSGDAGPSIAVGDDGTVFVPFELGANCDVIDGIVAIKDDQCHVVTLASHFGGRCSFEVGQGPSFEAPRTLRFFGGQLYTAQVDGSLMKVDPTTGAREIVASSMVGTGEPIVDTGAFTFRDDGTLWALLDARTDGAGGFQFGTIDYASTGNRTLTPGGLSDPYAAVLPHPSQALVFATASESAGGVVWVVDPATGNKNVFSF